MTSANEIRSLFLDYFRRQGHAVLPSSPLVPRNDPTLMFTNAGMVQFKNVFTGAEPRVAPRATTSQKCVRAGGKHNDLENVGYTSRHLTFFEMLGNFSFGDYFKEEAIAFAWELSTKELGLDPARIWVTVHPADDVAPGLWRRISGLPDARIVAHPSNLWAMGPTGPCGYCSELFYDNGPAVAGGPPGSPDEDGDRYLEFYNLVFMQFEQLADGTRIDLPRPSIDTGMGLERITAIAQGKPDVFETDTMRALIEAAAGGVHADPRGPFASSFKVIADHLRSSAFLIADGVLPSNEGRGYVLRRIMRRGMRHAHIAGAREPLMFRLVEALVREMGGAYPDLTRAQPLITETLRLEETRFKQTLERGLRLLEEETAGLAEGASLAGETAFRLYDTYGFPLDLTQDVLRARGIFVDQAGFDAAMARQKAEARRAWAGSGEQATEQLWFDLRERLGATEFLGYATERAEGVVTALLVEGRPVERAGEGTELLVVTNQTPFYGESGGQVGDAGTLTAAGGGVIAVRDTQKEVGDLFVHVGQVTHGTVAVGEALVLTVDGARRAAIRANHSATHLLHEALRRRLGTHVTQKGSLVAPDRLRFDISHPLAVTGEELADVAGEVNRRVRANSDVTTRLMPVDDAIASGAMALFGEKYGEEVRVVSMGGTDPGEGKAWSVELCGGTHVSRTGEIGAFHVIGEGAVAAGVRRIEALTGAAALDWFARQDALLRAASDALKVRPEELPARVAALAEERRRLERELAEARRKLATGGGGDLAPSMVGDVAYLGRVLENTPPKNLKSLADELKLKLKSGVVTLVAVNEGKASVVVGVTDDLTARFSAVDLVRVAAASVGGQGGGGRPDMAQAGGPDGERAADAVAAVERRLAG